MRTCVEAGVVVRDASDQLLALLRALRPPTLIPAALVRERSLWMGRCPTSRIHFDGLDNLHYVVRGTKRFVLWSPWDTPRLCEAPPRHPPTVLASTSHSAQHSAQRTAHSAHGHSERAMAVPGTRGVGSSCQSRARWDRCSTLPPTPMPPPRASRSSARRGLLVPLCLSVACLCHDATNPAKQWRSLHGVAAHVVAQVLLTRRVHMQRRRDDPVVVASLGCTPQAVGGRCARWAGDLHTQRLVARGAHPFAQPLRQLLVRALSQVAVAADVDVFALGALSRIHHHATATTDATGRVPHAPPHATRL